MADNLSSKINIAASMLALIARSQFHYRLNSAIVILGVFIREITTIIVIYLTLMQFDTIAGWESNELVLLFSFLFLTYSIVVLLFTGLRDFEQLVYSGKLDIYLTKPHGLLYLVVISNSDLYAAAGHGLLGVLLFGFSLVAVDIDWSLFKIVFLAFSLISGVAIQASILLIVSSLSFVLVKSQSIFSLVFWNTRSISGYPISIYPEYIQSIVMFIVPFAFVNYFPSIILLDKTESVSNWGWFIYSGPLVAIAFMLIASRFWKYGVTRYSSTGSSNG